MFAQWWGDVLAQSAIFVQRLVMWDNEAFQNPTTTQTQTLCASPANAQDFETAKQKSSRAFAYWFCSFSNWFSIAWGR
jgi:hypothetical protein